MMINEINCKTVLQKSKLPESPYCLNPYVGCIHNCVYCYARFMRRFTGHTENWGSFVDIKVNAPIVLARQLKKSSVQGPVLIGSVCDAYQPQEKKYNITRKCLEIFVAKGLEFSILTKSSLVRSDIDLLLQAGQKCSVGFSFSTLDDSIRKIFEPGASPVADRITALRELHNAGIRTYLFLGPILPLITDPVEITYQLRPYADQIWGEALNLRCGNRDGVLEAYRKAGFEPEPQILVGGNGYWQKVEKDLIEACKELRVSFVGFYRHGL